MNEKGKLFIAYIFWGGMGLVSLYIAVDTFITGTGPRGQDLLFNQFSNPILRYAVAYLFIGFSIPCLILPFLFHKGILPLDYYNSPKHIKSKTNVIIGTLMLPACTVLFLIFYNVGCNNGLHCNKAIIGGMLFGGIYLYNIFNLIRYYKKNS